MRLLGSMIPPGTRSECSNNPRQRLLVRTYNQHPRKFEVCHSQKTQIKHRDGLAKIALFTAKALLSRQASCRSAAACNLLGCHLLCPPFTLPLGFSATSYQPLIPHFPPRSHVLARDASGWPPFEPRKLASDLTCRRACCLTNEPVGPCGLNDLHLQLLAP